MRKLKAFFLIIIFFLLCGVLLYVIPRFHIARRKYPNLPYRRTIAQLAKRLSSENPSGVYRFIQTSYQRHDPVAVHDILHWFGSTLYEKQGAEGLALCDSSFNWGCFHGFLGTALAKEGKQLLSSVETICLEAPRKPFEPNGCLHGIGHGLLSLAGGYEESYLRRALSDCDRLISLESQKACYNGVFMEYNMRTMVSLNDGSSHIRQLDAKQPLGPCDTLDVRYQADCYYEQTDWWRLTIGRDWKRMGAYCAKIKGSTVSESCFRGIGRGIWGESKFTPQEALTHCLTMPSQEGVEACASIIAEELITLKNDPAGARRFCQILPIDIINMCEARLDRLEHAL